MQELPAFWDESGAKLHLAPDQRRRQHSACQVQLQPEDVNPALLMATIDGYQVSTAQCTCPDFARRRKPCKHMYRLAHEIGYHTLEPLTRAKNQVFTTIESLPASAQKLLRDLLYLHIYKFNGLLDYVCLSDNPDIVELRRSNLISISSSCVERLDMRKWLWKPLTDELSARDIPFSQLPGKQKRIGLRIDDSNSDTTFCTISVSGDLWEYTRTIYLKLLKLQPRLMQLRLRSNYHRNQN
ncbi:SWIM zinc finger domain-containing protein [bacterium]|nr:SWIM zinc finger domain-containing protein [bacterium]